MLQVEVQSFLHKAAQVFILVGTDPLIELGCVGLEQGGKTIYSTLHNLGRLVQMLIIVLVFVHQLHADLRDLFGPRLHLPVVSVHDVIQASYPVL